MLGPCDGPPPEAFVTPLGNSLPTAANGSIAPLAPDASAALRTIRALNDEAFDVVHVHEPLAPGTADDVGADAPGARRRHVPRRRPARPSYQVFGWFVRWVAERIDRKVVVSKDALELVQSAISAASTTSCSTASRSTRSRSTRADADRRTRRSSSAAATRSARASPCCSRRSQSLPADARLWIASDGPDSARAARSSTPTTTASRWLGRISDAEKFARLRGADVFCAPSLHGESFGVVLIEAMAAGTPVVASGIDGYRNVATDGVDAAARRRPATSTRWPRRCGEVLDDDDLAGALRAAGARRAQDFAMTHAGRRVRRASTAS